MARVIWSRDALSHLELITSYIAQFDPAAADRFAIRLINAGESLSAYPRRGRPTAEGWRELPTIPPYIIQYEVRGDAVHILHVRHGRQRR
jgi:plasmid stabilization system protein ParE